jgi:hypothetical protein
MQKVSPSVKQICEGVDKKEMKRVSPNVTSVG